MKVDEFKYLELIIQSHGQWTREVKKRVQEAGVGVDKCQGGFVTDR